MNKVAGSTRLYFVDWLPVMAMLSIFLFHDSRGPNIG